MKKTSYFHKNHSDFKRTVTVLESEEDELPVALVEYFFEGEVRPKLHKKSRKPHLPRLPSMIDSVDRVLEANPEQGPSSIYINAVEDVVNKQVAEVPRYRRQVTNLTFIRNMCSHPLF